MQNLRTLKVACYIKFNENPLIYSKLSCELWLWRYITSLQFAYLLSYLILTQLASTYEAERETWESPHTFHLYLP
jgi:hypothetical protein